MTDDDTYYYLRAQTELEQAERSIDPKVTAAHYQLAEAYLSRLPTTPAQVEPS